MRYIDGFKLNREAQNYFDKLKQSALKAKSRYGGIVCKSSFEFDDRLEVVEDGDFFDPVLGKCNIKKAMEDRNNAIKKNS